MPDVVGRGFDSHSARSKPIGPFSTALSISSGEYTQFRFISDVFVSEADFTRKVNLSFNGSAPVAIATNIGAGFNLASETTRGKKVLVYVFFIQAVRRRAVANLDAQLLESDQQLSYAKQEALNYPDTFTSKYGDSYISHIDYGTQATISVEFSSDNVEKMRKFTINLQPKAAVGPSLDVGIGFAKEAKSLNIKSKIDVRTTGFLPDQVPVYPRQLSDIQNWLQQFAQSLASINSDNFPTPVSYGWTSYRDVIPAQVQASLEESNRRGKYLSSIDNCRQHVTEYLEYCNRTADVQIAGFVAISQKLDTLKKFFDTAYDMDSVEARQSIDELQAVINILNAVQLKDYVVNECSAKDDFSANKMDGDILTDRRISKSFQLKDLPIQLVGGFKVLVKHAGPRAPTGTLTFVYSMDPQLPFNKTTHTIKRINNIGETEAEIPWEIRGTEQLNAVYLGFQYTRWTSKYTCNKVEEEFAIDAVVTYKSPAQIEAVRRPMSSVSLALR